MTETGKSSQKESELCPQQKRLSEECHQPWADIYTEGVLAVTQITKLCVSSGEILHVSEQDQRKGIICDLLHFERKFKEAACSVPFFQPGVLLWASVTRSFSNHDSFLPSSNNYVSPAGKFDRLSGLLKDRKFHPHSHSSESSVLFWISRWNHYHFTSSQN